MSESSPVNSVILRRAALVQRIGWGSIAVCAFALVSSIWFQPVGLGPLAIAIALAILTTVRPIDGMLLVAGIGPVAAILLILTRKGSADLRFSEALILAFIAGWSARRVARPRALALPRWLFWSAIPLIAAAVASAVISIARYAAQQPGTYGKAIAMEIVRDYLHAAVPLTPAMLFAEGLVVFLIVADACAESPNRRDAVLRMMVAGAAGAAFINVLRIVLAGETHDHPWTAALGYFWSVRVNVQYGDLNAAGSYFAMMLFIAAGLMWERALPLLPALLMIAAGLWLSGSRTALAAAMAAITAALGMLAISVKRRQAVVLAVSSIVIVGIVAGGLWRQYPREKNAAPSAAWQIRVGLAEAALKMAADHPVFGVGLGRFHELSTDYSDTPQLEGSHENAHNNFLQVLAELGAPGMLLFSAVVVLSLRTLLGTPPVSGTTYGLLAGLIVFLLTCLGGHPLLVHGAAYPFWFALGTAAAQGPPAASPTRWPRLVGIALVALLALTLPSRISAARDEANLEGASVGFSKWQHATDGTRYRWAGSKAALFVPSTTRWVEIPLRHGPSPPETVHVRLLIDGREANRVLLPNDGQWHVVRLPMVRRTTALYSRIEIQVELATALTPFDPQTSNGVEVLMVGKPVPLE